MYEEELNHNGKLLFFLCRCPPHQLIKDSGSMLWVTHVPDGQDIPMLSLQSQHLTDPFSTEIGFLPAKIGFYDTLMHRAITTMLKADYNSWQ